MTSCSWLRSAKTSDIPIDKYIVQARACQTCPEICGAKFMVCTEIWNILELFEEGLHDWEYERVPQLFDLYFELT